MALVKAKMAFYHDSVGTRANGEVFEVRNEQLCATLEQQGYIQKVEGQEAQAHQEQQQLQQEVGRRNALTNEAVGMTHHQQNLQANQHTQDVQQVRQQQMQSAEQAQQQQQAQANQQNADQHNEQAANNRATAKKADK